MTREKKVLSNPSIKERFDILLIVASREKYKIVQLKNKFFYEA